jgi:hypothetical protein
MPFDKFNTQKSTVNEQIGIAAGSDVYATARGTAKKMIRALNSLP